MVKGSARPSDTTIKRLFARSSNHCAYPRCMVKIVQGDTVVGEICHIRAAKPDGPRHDPNQSPSDRHGYENLILLCANHHKVIDDDPEAYTVERLLKMKADHENQAATLAASTIERATHFLVDESVMSLNQSGGITAHTVHQTIHVHSPGTSEPATSERHAILSRLRDFHEARTNAVEAGAAPVHPSMTGCW
jgi:HNH endonuclease